MFFSMQNVILKIHVLGTEIELTMFEGFDAGHFFCKAIFGESRGH